MSFEAFEVSDALQEMRTPSAWLAEPPRHAVKAWCLDVKERLAWLRRDKVPMCFVLRKLFKPQGRAFNQQLFTYNKLYSILYLTCQIAYTTFSYLIHYHLILSYLILSYVTLIFAFYSLSVRFPDGRAAGDGSTAEELPGMDALRAPRGASAERRARGGELQRASKSSLMFRNRRPRTNKDEDYKDDVIMILEGFEAFVLS